MMQRARIRSLLRQMHLILAAVAGLPLLLLGLTGALLVFPDQIDTWTTGVPHAVPATGSRLGYGEIVRIMDSALAADDQANRLVFGSAPGSIVTAGSLKGVSLAVDPYSGRVLRASSAWTPVRFLTWLHVTLALGNVGPTISGVASLLLCCLCATGLILWWPVGVWKAAYFQVRSGLGWKRWNFDLHRATGFYSTWALLLIALSGAAMAFHDQAAAIAYTLTFSTATPAERPKIVFERHPAITPDRAVEIAAVEFPDWQVYRLYVPVPKTPYYRVFLNPPHAFKARYAEARLEIHPQTGEIFLEESLRTRSRGDQALMWVLPLHFGTWGGVPMRWIYVLASLCPVVLSATGGLLWWVRHRKRRRGRHNLSNEPALDSIAR